MELKHTDERTATVHSDLESYSEYLQRRSWLGKIYRQHLLYPKLNRHLSGLVLDYGCGIGDFVQYRANTIGADINPHNVLHCTERNLNAVHIAANSPLPFGDNTFTGVVMDNVLEHLPPEQIEGVITELIRVAKHGSTFVVGVPAEKGFASDPDHKVFYSPSDLVTRFNPYHLQLSRKYYMPFDCPLLGKYMNSYCLYAVFSLEKP